MCLSIATNHPEAVLATGTHAGLEWVVTHNAMGHRCGYFRVPAGHPWHGTNYDEVPADAHGGLTFAEPDFDCGKGRDENGFWFGFDCAHYGDSPDPALPGSGRLAAGFANGIVRTQEWVESECKRLCAAAQSAMNNGKRKILTT